MGWGSGLAGLAGAGREGPGDPGCLQVAPKSSACPSSCPRSQTLVGTSHASYQPCSTVAVRASPHVQLQHFPGAPPASPVLSAQPEPKAMDGGDHRLPHCDHHLLQGTQVPSFSNSHVSHQSDITSMVLISVGTNVHPFFMVQRKARSSKGGLETPCPSCSCTSLARVIVPQPEVALQ